MPVPTHIFDPPFNIIRCSHAVLDVTDLNASREFYENSVGLHVEDRFDPPRYLKPGDVIEVEADGVGVLCNGVIE